VNTKRLCVIALLFYACCPAWAQPDADFTWQSSQLASYLVRFRSLYQPHDTLNFAFEWNFGDGSISHRPNPDHLFPDEGSYTVELTVTDRSTLDTDQSSQTVTVHFQLEVPNVFTPNGDGHNDVFMILSDGREPLTIRIFNRWGNLVYRVTTSTVVWDGRTVDGTPVQPGNYYYILTSHSGDVRFEKTGFIRIFR